MLIKSLHPYVTRQAPCYRCTLSSLSYLHSSLSSIQSAITLATLVTTQPRYIPRVMINSLKLAICISPVVCGCITVAVSGRTTGNVGACAPVSIQIIVHVSRRIRIRPLISVEPWESWSRSICCHEVPTRQGWLEFYHLMGGSGIESHSIY